jgi:protoporphyrinogen oxidase
MPPRIVILGAGPTGLGAACRLRELGYDNWHLYEKAPTAGGLSGSITDANGFTWDYGGHVLFSTFTRVDRLLDSLGTKFFHHHQRRAYIRLHAPTLSSNISTSFPPHCGNSSSTPTMKPDRIQAKQKIFSSG